MKPVVSGAKRDHRHRKNPAAVEAFAKLRHERNAQRSPQIWIGGTAKEGGHWTR